MEIDLKKADSESVYLSGTKGRLSFLLSWFEIAISIATLIWLEL